MPGGKWGLEDKQGGGSHRGGAGVGRGRGPEIPEDPSAQQGLLITSGYKRGRLGGQDTHRLDQPNG